MAFKDVLSQLLERQDLTQSAMLDVMRQVMGGELTPAQISAFLIALRAKGETVDEIAAAAMVMRELSTKVDIQETSHLIDTCGTGGDGIQTFNVSTVCAFVAAAAGAKVAKHGGRSVSSTCGSADVLETLGVNVNQTPAQVADCVNEIGIGFMFAPNHHPAMKNVVPIRKDLGVRTIFNILGPLTNPADAKRILMGVFHADLVGIQARVLQAMGMDHALVVYGRDGLDEISLEGPTLVGELKDGQVREYEIHPKDFGLNTAPTNSFKVANAEESKAIVLDVLNKAPGPASDIVCLNAGAVLYVANVAPSIASGIQMAQAAIASGAARQKLDQFVAATQN